MGPVPPESGVRLGLLLRMKKNQTHGRDAGPGGTQGAGCEEGLDARRRLLDSQGRPAPWPSSPWQHVHLPAWLPVGFELPSKTHIRKPVR